MSASKDNVDMPFYLPLTLRQQSRWGVWRLHKNLHGRLTKEPAGSTNGPQWRRPFEDVEDVPRSPEGGIGFSFSGGHLEVAPGRFLYSFDADACRDPKTGELAPWVASLLDLLHYTFTEITPSETGLRPWFTAAKATVIVRSKVRVREPELPAGNTKTVECQLFGHLPGGSYVATTGNQLEGTTKGIYHLPDWQLILDLFPVFAIDDPVCTPPAAPTTPPPPPGQLTQIAEQTDFGRALIAGDWPAMLDADDSSASEAFYRGARFTLNLAEGHHEVALDWILGDTAWGQGQIENSHDPLKYARRNWVAKELNRVARKTGAGATGFVDLGEDSNGRVAPPPQDRRRVLPVLEYMARGDDAEDLIKGLLPAIGLCQVFGEPSCGKTPFVMSACFAVAGTVEWWHGLRVRRHGTVIYVVGEGEGGMRKRLRAMGQATGISLESIQETLHLTTAPMALSEPADVARWITEMSKLDDVVLVVFDTLSANFGSGNESDTKDMNAVVAALGHVKRELGACVVLTHHPGQQNKDRGRGSSVLPGALDVDIRVVKTENEVAAFLRKGRDADTTSTTPVVRGHLEVVTLGQDDEGDPITSVALVEPSTFTSMNDLTDIERMVFDAVSSGHRTASEIERDPDLAIGRRRAVRTLERLTDLGLLRMTTQEPDAGGRSAAQFEVSTLGGTEGSELLS